MDLVEWVRGLESFCREEGAEPDHGGSKALVIRGAKRVASQPGQDKLTWLESVGKKIQPHD